MFYQFQLQALICGCQKLEMIFLIALAIHFLGDDWQPKHITLGLFEPTNTTRQTLAKKMIELLDSYALRIKIITYVKDEGFNLNNMTTIVSCDMLGLEENFQGICFGHTSSNAC